ncbi:glycoside hydrolase family 127 protein [Mucilaginibacter gynuensis]|uniref:Glycoside hydrolase family 127 protein n=1 Tax=Mucilaginibacter gynuensis TaxID=1302236 RepID=A0ABP8GFG5_9SPHI
MKAKITAFSAFTAAVLLTVSARAQQGLVKMTPVNFSQVQINDAFWSPRINTVTTVTIPVCINQTEVITPRIRNFEKVARKQGEKHEGIYYDDSDVYKALEAIAYSLKNHPDPKLEAKADEWIDKIAAAQLPDGYLNTYYTLSGIDKRWTDMEKHEDYNAGHLIEAAVAYYNTTGKRKLLDVAMRVADNIDATFKQKDLHWVSGHEEIELALVKLYKATGKSKYLDLADWYLQQRGHGYGKGAIWTNSDMGEKYCQDDVPVKDQKQIEGHAVRAMYLYTGAADVGAAKNDPGYLTSMNHVWEDVVFRNMYITGGIGSSGSNEGFTTDFDLPNSSAYCETCASVGMVIWNERMNLLTGNAKYVDILEKSLYNGALDGLSLSGDRFFYGNPLASANNYQRSEWFGTACCPSNIARLVESLGDYIYASSANDIWVNLFVGSSTTIPLKNGKVELKQETGYPWNGQIKLTIGSSSAGKFPLHVRIPGWANNNPASGTTYRFTDKSDSTVNLSLNGKPVKYTLDNGYAVISSNWKKGDVLTLNLPMPVRMVAATDSIRANRNKVALQRGPLIYCVEQLNDAGTKQSFIIPDNVAFSTSFNKDLLNGIVTIKANVPVIKPSEDGKSVKTEQGEITAIPYYSWANRGHSQMDVWLPAKVSAVSLKASKDDN